MGGILAGQSLIKAAGLRSVSVEYQRYVTATQAFKDKYFYFPGDMANATAFWGIAAGTTGNDATCKIAISTDQKTCNGNGNNIISNAPTSSNETYAFWKHLANAGLIEGSYTGGNGAASPGNNIPRSKLGGNVAWQATYSGLVTGSSNVFDADYGNLFRFFEAPTQVGVLLPSEAWNIDTKMDDGKPGSGKILANWANTYSAASVACTNAADGTNKNADYNLTSNSKDCGFYFPNL